MIPKELDGLDPHFVQRLKQFYTGESQESDHATGKVQQTPAHSELPRQKNAHPEGTGVKTRLNEGVRLILLPDLLIGALKRAILRHPNAAGTPPSEFNLYSPHIAQLCRSEYSIEPLRRSFEEAVPRLARLMPEPLIAFILKKASAPPDEFNRLLESARISRLASNKLYLHDLSCAIFSARNS